MIGQLGAGYIVPEGKTFYLMKNGVSKVQEIRIVMHLESGIKYLIDIKKGQSKFVSKEEFYFVPEHHTLLKIK